MTTQLLRMTIASLIVSAVACDPELQESETSLRAAGPMLEVCGPECLALIQDCDAGEACLWGGDEWTCQTRSDDRQWAQACTGATQCDAGLLCMEGARVPGCAADNCCAQLCDAADPNDVCPGDSACTDVFDDGHDDAGACLIPVVPSMPPLLCMEQSESFAKGPQ